MAHSEWKEPQKAIFAVRLQASDIRGLTIAPIHASYIINYANGLVGRHLKMLAQVAPFHLYDLVTPLEFKLWKAVGDLTALFWYPEIHNMDQYLVSPYVEAVVYMLTPLHIGRPRGMYCEHAGSIRVN